MLDLTHSCKEEVKVTSCAKSSTQHRWSSKGVLQLYSSFPQVTPRLKVLVQNWREWGSDERMVFRKSANMTNMANMWTYNNCPISRGVWSRMQTSVAKVTHFIISSTDKNVGYWQLQMSPMQDVFILFFQKTEVSSSKPWDTHTHTPTRITLYLETICKMSVMRLIAFFLRKNI